MRNYKWGVSVLVVGFLWQDIAYAYIDPGFSGTLYQLVYFLIFGVALNWVLRPFQFIRGLFSKKKDSSEGSESKSDAESVTQSTSPDDSSSTASKKITNH